MSLGRSDNPVIRSDLAKDLDAILALPATTKRQLQSLTTSSSPSSAQSSTALQFLDSYSLSSTDLDASQNLIGAYVRDMRKDVLSMDRTEQDQMGVRLDQVRDKAEGIKESLGKVKL